MSHGGERPGAGRKPGGTNRFNQRLLARAEESGILPVDYMLGVMRDESLDTRLRIDAAKAAAPYVHQKLSAISVDLAAPDVTHEEWLKSLSG